MGRFLVAVLISAGFVQRFDSGAFAPNVQLVFRFAAAAVALALGATVLLGAPVLWADDPDPLHPDTGEQVGLFFYSSDPDKKVYTAYVNSQGIIKEGLYYGSPWRGTYGPMARFDVGDKQYIMGHSDTGYWWIQQIYSTGDLGPKLDDGHWGHYYETLVGVHAGERTFLFAQDEGDGHLVFTVEITEKDGLISNDIYNREWANYYHSAGALFSKETGRRLGKNYIYGLHHSSKKTASDMPFFIQRVDDTGMLTEQTEWDEWDHFYENLIPFELSGGRTFLFGQNDWLWDKCRWFTQHFLQDPERLAGYESDNGNCDDLGEGLCPFYETVASYNTVDGTFLFFQDDGGLWFTRMVDDHDGEVGSSDHQSGGWDYYYKYVFPFAFDAFYLNVENWMTFMWEKLKTRKLSQVALPASHDSGMSPRGPDDSHWCALAGLGGNACNTQTQYKDIAGQLEHGARYFDIRPITKLDTWFTGHFYLTGFDPPYPKILGCAGEELDSVLTSVKSFVEAYGHEKELVILALTHCFDYHAEGSCSSSQTEDITDLIKQKLGSHLVTCDECDLYTMSLSEILDRGQVIALVEHADSDKANGIFNYDSDLPIYDHYANNNNYNDMKEDQFSKLLNANNHNDELFLLSWTLTLDSDQALDCMKPGDHTSMQDLAAVADDNLVREIVPLVQSGKINKTHYPNFLYVDSFNSFATRAAMYLNRNYEDLSESRWEVLEETPGPPPAVD